MSWTAPSTVATGDFINAALWNTYVRDNTIDLDRRTTPVGASIVANEATTATAYGNLATVGPAVTVTIGSTGKALVSIFSQVFVSTNATAAFESVDVSGATTISADSFTGFIYYGPNVANSQVSIGVTTLQTGFNAGSTTFTAKYKMSGGGNAQFTSRFMSVTPLGS